MHLRVSPIRSKILVVAIATIGFLSIVFSIIQVETLRAGSENSQIQRDISVAQLIELYVELEVPGEWQARGGQLYKGDRELARQEYSIRSALSEFLHHDTVIEFGVGSIPAIKGLDKGKPGLSVLESLVDSRKKADGSFDADRPPDAGGLPEPGAPPPGVEPGPRFDKPDHPFSTDDGAGVVVKDGDDDPVGWILIKSGWAASAARGNRTTASFVWSVAFIDALIIAALSFMLFRLSRPIDVIAEERVLAEERSELLANMAKIDPLTGLLNRRGVEEAVADARYRGLAPSHVAFVDVDHFKAINDARGHEGGDRALAAIAGGLSGGIRQQDICGRWGGEEFALVLYGQSDAGIAAWAERVRASIEALELGGESDAFRATITIGVAALGSKSFPDALASADEAMYRGKREGRNRVVVAATDAA